MGTLLVTVLAMVVGVVLGRHPRGDAALAQPGAVRAWPGCSRWFFRAIPRYVLLLIMGALGILFQQGGLSLGVPFDWTDHGACSACNGNLRFLTLDANEIFAGLVGGMLGPRPVRGGVHGRDRPRRHPRRRQGPDARRPRRSA